MLNYKFGAHGIDWISLMLIIISCTTWFIAQHLAIRERKRHDAYVALCKQRLDAAGPTWQSWEGY